MRTDSAINMPVKPRVLIADDSRIVRATLIKHIQGMFDFREALNGEEAWETLLIDPSIRVVITDLSMPKLDGYGLLHKIRSSEIRRIRSLPVVVVSGSDNQDERDRAKAAGATDLITKGIDTAQLLSRLDILAKLVNTQREFEHSLEILAKNISSSPELSLLTPETLDSCAEQMLAHALFQNKNFVMLNVLVGLKHTGLNGHTGAPSAAVIHAIGQLLQRTIRQTDRVAQTGDAEFTLITNNIHVDTARNFAQRICRAISNANMVKDEHMSFVASCGLVSSLEQDAERAGVPVLGELKAIARQRSMIGLNQATTGIVGLEEARLFKQTGQLPPSMPHAGAGAKEGGTAVAKPAVTLSFRQPDEQAATHPESVELSTLVQWIKEGRQDKVLRHMQELSEDLKPLVELLLQQGKH